MFTKDHLFLQTFSRDDVFVDGKVFSILHISLFQNFLWAHFTRLQSNVYKVTDRAFHLQNHVIVFLIATVLLDSSY